MSLRELSVYMAHMPPGSALWAAEHGIAEGLSLTDILLMDVFGVLAGEEHPARPKPATAKRARDLREKLRAQRARLAASQPPT